MKQLVPRFAFLLTSGLLAAGTAQAQSAVPNGTMETWLTRSGSDSPAQWLTTDDALRLGNPGLPTTGSVLKSTTSHGGSFAAQLVSISSPNTGEAPGFLALGNSFGNLSALDSLVQVGGLPYTARPARLQFYYKFSGTITRPEDRPLVHLQLTKTTNGVRQTVASGRLYLPAAGTYTLADVPLRYRLGVAPDSLHLAFGSGDFDGARFTAGNTLFLDDIVLTGTVAATRDAQLQAALSVYPNPSASGLFTLAAAQEPALLAAPFTVTDALGRVVLRQPAGQPGAGPRSLDLRQQPAGVYSLLLDTPRGPVVHQLVIR